MSKSDKNEATQADIAKRALEEKRKSESDAGHEHLDTRTSHEGQVEGSQEGAPKNGMLDAEGNRPVLERSRKVR